MRLLFVTVFLALSSVTCNRVNSDRMYSLTSNSDDDLYSSSYQVSPMLPVRKPFAYRSYKASTMTPSSLNDARVMPSSSSSSYRPISMSHRDAPSFYRNVRVNSIAARNLQASPSMMSPSASVPFFYRNSQVKKLSKKVSPTREKAIHTPPVPKSQDTVDWSAEDMMQHPIDEAPRKSNRSLGLPCSYSSDCGSGCCLLDRETKIRSCQPLARMGDRCTKSQVKGDLYVDACPCMRGADLCSSNNRCSW